MAARPIRLQAGPTPFSRVFHHDLHSTYEVSSRADESTSRAAPASDTRAGQRSSRLHGVHHVDGVLALRARVRRQGRRPPRPSATVVVRGRGSGAAARAGGGNRPARLLGRPRAARRGAGGGLRAGGPAPGHGRVPRGRPVRGVARELLPAQLRRPPRLPRVPDHHRRRGPIRSPSPPAHLPSLLLSLFIPGCMAGLLIGCDGRRSIQSSADEPDGEALGRDVAPRAGGQAGAAPRGGGRLLRRAAVLRSAGGRRGWQVRRGRLQEGHGQGAQRGQFSVFFSFTANSAI